MGILALAMMTACTPAATPTLTSTVTPSPTATATLSPTLTLSPTVTLTPSATLTPSDTPTITPTPYPAVAPQPTVGLSIETTRYTIDKSIKEGIGQLWISYVNINDKPSTVIPGTPAAANQLEAVYLADPGTGTRVKVIDLPASVGQRIYWSPNGAYMAYFIDPSSGIGGGLYILNLNSGVSTRLFVLPTLNPRGILSNPIWSPDSTQLILAMTTDYDVDIYSVGVDGTDFRDITQSGGFDFWPAWSPDGQYLAFVSDRKQCPSWVPNDPQSCYKPDAATPDGGNLYVVSMAGTDNAPRLLADTWVTAPPHWISRDSLAFISGQSGDPTAGSTLWYVDLRDTVPHRVTDADPQGKLIIADAWSSDGNRVAYQEATTSTRIVIRDSSGNEIAHSTDDLNFPRYAFSAAWSPDDKKLVIGGHNSQCPYGMIVTDDSFNPQVMTAAANPNPGVCDPSWSPDGKWIAFGGVTQSGSGTDGRYDVYVAESSGYGTRQLSAKLGGQIRLIGWVGGR